MSTRLISTLIKKDLMLFSRDRFYFLLTVVGLITYIVLYLVMPKTMEETLKLGIYASGMPQINNFISREQGIEIESYSTLAELRDAVNKDEIQSGIVLPDDFLVRLSNEEQPKVTIYFSSSAPEELKGAITSLVKQWASMAAGREMVLEIQPEILGPDLLGSPIPWRDRFIPVLIILILGTEILSLASLISTELEQNTVRALLVTPLKIRHIFAAKAILGIGLAFIQVTLFAAIVGNLFREPLAMILALFIGSLLVTSSGFLVASLSRNMMNVSTWGMIITIIFFIPAIGVLMPGLLSGWAEILPSYHLIDAINRLTNYGAGFSNITTHLLIMLGWSVLLAVIGIMTLRRRYR